MKPVKQDTKKDKGLGRRDLMKIGAGAVMATLGSGSANAQEAAEGTATGEASGSRPTNLMVWTGAGYKNDANRISGNGPMDGTSRQLVEYTTSFSESAFKDNMARANTIMLDQLAALIAGFESEPARILARMGRIRQASEMKSTIMGYGITTNPESASFANSSMVRHVDYNDSQPGHGGHASTAIPGILAIGEAFHSTGLEVLVAVGLAYEIMNGINNASGGGGGGGGPFDGVATALAAGKLMKLNEDQLANAMSLTIVGHTSIGSNAGPLSHWKGCHQPMSVTCGVYSALLAREGMTGPAQPFEERGGWFERFGAFQHLRLPVSPNGLGIEHFRLKRFPAEGSTQGTLEQIPAIREWAKPDEIESIQVEVGFGQWQETASPGKWDPRNRETADHSLPYLIAVALTDGEIYLDAFKPERYLHDTAIRTLMEKITVRANADFKGAPDVLDERSHITIRKKSGDVLVKDSFGYHNPTHDDVIAKFKRVCDYMSVSNEQRDRALATWPNLRAVKDIAEPIRDMANFGKPLPL